MSDLHIVFRVDASVYIGVGHLYRCLTLAEEYRNLGATIHFICRNHQGNINQQIKRKGYKVYELPLSKKHNFQQNLKGYDKWLGSTQDIDASETIEVLINRKIDWLIVDHYAIDCQWEVKLRPYAKKIMVIDDMANRKHSCDILLDQTYLRKQRDYRGLVPRSCKLLLGTEFALLRPEFALYRKKALQFREEHYGINNVLVAMGGMDDENITSKILDAIALLESNISITVTVVLAAGAPHLQNIKKNLHKYIFPINIFSNVSNMAELMLNADLAIGAGGTTSWERCCLGLPTILIVLSENQNKIGENLANIGAVITLHKNNKIEEAVSQSINTLIKDNKKYIDMSHIAAEVCDGNGTKRTVKQMMN